MPISEQELHQHIEFTPLKGREPVFRGTNIRVSHVLDDFCSGMKSEEILRQHPKLSELHLQALFVFCRVMLKENDALRFTSLIGLYT